MSATLSSTHDTHVASNCIDNDMNTFCHSQPDTEWPWLSIELPTPSEVSYVLIHNRLPGDRLSPFQLWVGQSVGDYNSPTSAACGLNLTGSYQPIRSHFAGPRYNRAPNTVPPEVNARVGDLTEPPTVGPFSYRCYDAAGNNYLTGNYLTLVLPGASRTLHISQIRAYSPFASPSSVDPATSPVALRFVRRLLA